MSDETQFRGVRGSETGTASSQRGMDRTGRGGGDEPGNAGVGGGRGRSHSGAPLWPDAHGNGDGR